MYTVAVVGGGVIGLPTALSLQKEFGTKTKVVIFTDKLSPHTTGDVAAGLWEPYLLQNTPQERIIKWAKDTQDFILELWKQGKAKDAGISLQLIINLTDEKNFQLPKWIEIALGYSEIPEEKIREYSYKYGEQFSGGFSFVSFIWEAALFLPFLQKIFLENGGEICVRNITSFDELCDFDVIVNCTGLGSILLVPDSLVRPIRGQISRVKAPWQFHTFMANTHGESNYVIPNQNCVVLGGTHQEDDFSTALNEDDKKHIFDGCFKYIPALKNAPVIVHQVGLRPGRIEVRLELENRRIAGKEVNIVHNYGHGGSGVTLSIGCALEAAQLVKEALGFSGQSKL